MSKNARFLLLAVTLLLPVWSWAGNPPRTVTITPFAGWHLFEGNLRVKDSAVGGLILGYNFTGNWGVEALGSYTATNLDAANDPDIEIYNARLEALRHFRAEQRLVPYVAFGAGVQNTRLEKEKAGNSDVMFAYGGGLKYFLPEGVALRLDARHLVALADSDAEHDYYQGATVTFGVTFPLDGRKAASAGSDSDGDGIFDSRDRCPGTPADVIADGNGCPRDTDGDGVIDQRDACPATPVGIAVDSRGCPLDSDGDGVGDSSDRCEATPSGTPVDASGCPQPRRFDADEDGVEDQADRCPNTPLQVPVNRYGCPSDSDGDGVFDIDDRCPDSAPATAVDASGCVPATPPSAAAVTAPPVAATAVASQPGFRLDVHFAEGKSAIPAKYESQLAAAAEYIKNNPAARFVVEGHTDSIGNEQANQTLSQKRAESVRNALVRQFGIAADRLAARGFGEKQPIADNSTPEGRLLNRRVVVVPLR